MRSSRRGVRAAAGHGGLVGDAAQVVVGVQSLGARKGDAVGLRSTEDVAGAGQLLRDDVAELLAHQPVGGQLAAEDRHQSFARAQDAVLARHA